MTLDPAFALAEHVVRTRFEDLPRSAVTATKNDVLDTFGCILGGSAAPGIADIFALFDEWGGTAESKVLLHSQALPAPHAAMINASMGHALDFDDTHDTAGSIHPGISVLAASLATADRLGGASGREFVLAVTLGLDIACRIALACTLDRGWHRTAAIGIFGATAAAGKLLGLTAEQMRHGLGIAYSHAAGNRQCILDGALTKRLQAGQAASGGIFSALLARRDFTGAHNIFNGPYGFLELYQPNGADPSLLTQDLGSAFRGEELSFKPYPCGRPLHAAIDAALAARAALGVTGADDVGAVTIEADPSGHASQFLSGPSKRRPTQVVEAQFAQPFLVATALVHGRVSIVDVASLGNADVQTLANRIEGQPLEGKVQGWFSITLRHRDGRTITVEATTPTGSPTKPLSPEQCVQKFRDNARNARRPLAEGLVAQALDRLEKLEMLADVRELTSLFA